MAPPTIILAIDSAETRLFEKYAAAGQLPFLGRFVKNWRIVEGPHHISEMGAWTTFWSGVPAAEHGYHCIRRLVPGEYAVKLTNGPEQPCPPFWSGFPGTVSIWDPQETDPDPSLSGEQLCNWRTSYADRCRPTPASHPASLLPDIENRYGAASRPVPVNLKDTPARREAYFQRSKDRIAASGRLFREALTRGGRDLYIFGTAELHSAGHLCWTHDADGERRMLELHQDVDRELESVCRLAPAGARILAVSAYGLYENFPCSEVCEQILRGLGYQVAPAGGGTSLKSLIPIGLRRKIGEFMPTETQERLINNALRNNTDWSRTVAFGMPTLYTGYVRINLRGREPQGIVEPGREYDEVVERIVNDFAQLESPVPAKIRRIGKLNGQPPRSLPDIMISWQERDKPWDAVVHPRFRAVLPKHKFHRSTYHSYRGFIGALNENVLDGVPPVLDIPDVAAHLRRICAQA